ncbi:hypothetical protein QL285_077392 [Trifolium repens]|nr:hypothetical protein QL285_077392 [Trifolium repens]
MERKRDSIPSTRARKRGKTGKEKVDEVESQELGTCFADLPFPIITDILLRLPIKSVLIWNLIDRGWLVKHFEKGTAILDYHSKKGFTYYDREMNRSKNFIICGTREKLLEIIPHIPSLISLKDIIKGDNVEVLNVQSRCSKFKLPEE